MGYTQSRDAKVVGFLAKAKYATAPQLAELFFQGVKESKNRYKIASGRLKTLCDQQVLHRSRLPGDYYIYSLEPFTYHPGIERYLTLVDVLVTLERIKPEGSKLVWEIDRPIGESAADLWIKLGRKEWFVFLSHEALIRARSDEENAGKVFVWLTQEESLSGEPKANGGEITIICINNIAETWKWD